MYFNGLQAPKDKIAVLQGSIACSSGLQGLNLLKFEKIALGNVWAPSFQNVELQSSSDPPPPLGTSLIWKTAVKDIQRFIHVDCFIRVLCLDKS